MDDKQRILNGFGFLISTRGRALTLIVASIILVSGCSRRRMFSDSSEGDVVERTQSYAPMIKEEMNAFWKWSKRMMDEEKKRARVISEERPQAKSSFKSWRSLVEERSDLVRKASRTTHEELLNVWAMTRRLHEYALTDEGGENLPDYAEQAAEQMALWENQVYNIAAAYLPDYALEEVLKSIEEDVAQRPLADKRRTNRFPFDFDRQVFSAVKTGQSAVSTIARIPLIPLKIGSGASDVGQGVTSLSETAERFTTIVENLPQALSEEMANVLDDVLARQPEIESMLKELSQTAGDLRGTMAHGENAAIAIRQSVEASTSALKEAQVLTESVRGASGELRQLAEALAPLLEGDSEKTDQDSEGFEIRDYERTANAIGANAEKVRALLADIKNLSASDDAEAKTDKEPSRPFDILDYERTSESIGKSAGELGGILRELRAINAEISGGAGESLPQAVNLIAMRVEKTIDRVFWRTVYILVLAFVLGLLVIAFAMRSRRRAG